MSGERQALVLQNLAGSATRSQVSRCASSLEKFTARVCEDVACILPDEVQTWIGARHEDGNGYRGYSVVLPEKVTSMYLEILAGKEIDDAACCPAALRVIKDVELIHVQALNSSITHEPQATQLKMYSRVFFQTPVLQVGRWAPSRPFRA